MGARYRRETRRRVVTERRATPLARAKEKAPHVGDMNETSHRVPAVSHAFEFSVFAMRARAFVASRASSRAFARPLARASSSRAHRPARALEKHKRVGARTRAFEDQDCDDFLSTSSVTTTETPDAWTESSFTRLDDGCVAFGVSHLVEGAHDAAEYILRAKPSVVVVETAMTSEHGDATGNAVNYEAGVSAMMTGGSSAPEALIFVTRLAGALKGELGEVADSPQWGHMKTQLPPEVLVYAAAFTVGATVVYGDRPKAVTYRRLMATPTLAELDGTFAAQSERNYRLLLPADHPLAAKANEKSGDFFEKIVIEERDCVLASTIRECVDKSDDGGEVVAVIGVDHVEGVTRIYKDTFASAENEARAEELCVVPDASADAPGVRIALAQRLMGLRCPPALVDDVERTLSSDVQNLNANDMIEFELASEVYGSSRMLMACVEDKEVLDAVVGGFNCDFSEDVLAPIRAVRPLNGGKGYSDDVINTLRTTSVVDFARAASS